MASLFLAHTHGGRHEQACCALSSPSRPTSRRRENQRLELERVATQRGWQVIAMYEDAGISGAKGREKRPGFDAMCKDMARCKFDIVAAWSVDRLGRSLQDLVGFLSDLQGAGRDLYLHQQFSDI
jgi:DNA invertase Pin-like site-specific DNA recombinase